MYVSPRPGDCKLILLQLQWAEEDFRGRCSERIRVKRSRAFGPLCYQISADSLPAAPGALEHITSWEGKGRPAEFYVCSTRCTTSTCEELPEGQKLSRACRWGQIQATSRLPLLMWARHEGQMFATSRVARLTAAFCQPEKNLMAENETSIRRGWSQYGIKIRAAATRVFRRSVRCKRRGGMKHLPVRSPVAGRS